MARVYVVDDDAAVLGQLVALFRSEGHETLGFANPLDVISAVIPQDEPVIIVCDMRMPGMSGLELKEELRGKGFASPIVFVSGESTQEEIVSAVDDPAVKYLLKPVFPDRLLATVNAMLRLEERRLVVAQHRQELQLRVDRLTATQKRIYDLLLSSMSNQEIAHELDMKPDTVKKHRQAVFDKFGVVSLFQLLEVVREAEG